MDSSDLRQMCSQAAAVRERYASRLRSKVVTLGKELEIVRSTGTSKKIPVVEEPERTPEKCFRDYLLAEIMWLQTDIALERKWKQVQSKKLGKEMLKHKYIVDRQAGVDITEQNLRRVSAILCTEVEKFWKGVRQLAHHRFSKHEARIKREQNQKRLDELVDRTEQYIKGGRKRTRSETLEEVEDLLEDAERPVESVLTELKGENEEGREPMELDKSSKTALLDQISKEMTAAAPTGNSLSTTRVTTTVPSLIRAGLREYQHIGLEWLATLHERGLNGILADEMGLGKTLQTISLLAHLAEHKGIWGPHLIVVPTSVMINWEIEFKKFLPGFKVLVYFGTRKERRAKRVGWRNDNVFNVCICSYALVLQDASMFRAKHWYYLILDEAHQIKNFKSLRWQNLLTFKTERRLLLTGTPLQNDLIELWSLLHFLMPHIFTSHLDFQEWFSDPLNRAIEHSKLDENSKLISRLHSLIRPFLLRRLKKDVETQMPSKYEHVIPVPLSRRQQVLYDELLHHRETRMTLKKKNDYLGLMNVLMQLRKVCNHPDLLEPRPVRSPFVMGLHELRPPKPASNLLVQWTEDREKKLAPKPFWYIDLSVGKYESLRSKELTELPLPDVQIDTRPLFQRVVEAVKRHKTPSLYLENEYVVRKFSCKKNKSGVSIRDIRDPLIGFDGIQMARRCVEDKVGYLPMRLVESVGEKLDRIWPYVSQFMAYTPPVIVSPYQHAEASSGSVGRQIGDLLHRPEVERMCRLPDARFLEWDSGKFRLLRSLLTKLRSENHKVILFTQMSRMLDVIEAFANLCGFTYVRLDGSTKVADRQLVVDRFNRDKKLFLFISSTRAGGVGINLTGADTVVFFDSDWNPAMDRQAMDRCHRIGQVRDVHIYRLVSEKTIEENIFVKQLQKRQLDHVVMDQGQFSTISSGPDQQPSFVKGIDDLLEGLLGSGTRKSDRSEIYGTHVLWERQETVSKSDFEMERLLSKVEDVEDVSAALVAAKEGEGEIEPVDSEDTEDPNYMLLPGIVRHSVEWTEALLVAEQVMATTAATPDDEEWEEIENAQWSSEDEDMSGLE